MSQLLAKKYYKLQRIIFTSILLCLCYCINAQEIRKEDVLKKYIEIKNLRDFNAKHDSLRKLSSKIIRLNTNKAISLYKSLDSLVDNEKLKLAYLIDWGVTASRSGDIVESKALRLKGLNIAKKYNDVPSMFNYNNTLSNFYINISQVDSATYYLKEAEKLVKLHPKQLDFISWTLHHRNYNIQGILGNLEGQDVAIEKAWENMARFPNHDSRGFLLFLITDHFRKRKNYLKQSKYAELLIEYYNNKKIATPNFHVPVKSVLLKNDSPEAIEDLKRVIKLCDSLNNLNALAFSSNTLAQVYIEKGKPELAVPILEKSITKLNDFNYPINHSLGYELLQKAYAQKEDYKSAFNVLTEQKALEDSLRSKEQMSKIADYEVKYETQEKERALEKKEANQKLLFWILGLSALVLLILSYFFIKNKRQNDKLKSQAILLNRSIDEKNVLLKEVHHRVKNSFQIVSSLLYLQSENITDKKAKLAIKEAENRVRSMVLVHQRLYNKDDLVGINSKEYISDLIKDIFESHQINKEPVNYNLNIESLVLDIETITPLGLIINELIINTMKHAFEGIDQKHLVNIDFSKIDNELVLKVSDNGKGFEGEVKQTSFGITLMKALSKQLKATLNYTSKPFEGTQVILNIKKFNILS